MSTTSDVRALRARATGLRSLAHTLERSSLHDLIGWVGPDTWMGPSPQRCVDDVRIRSSQFMAQAAELRARATRLDERARLLECAEPVRVGGPR